MNGDTIICCFVCLNVRVLEVPAEILSRYKYVSTQARIFYWLCPSKGRAVPRLMYLGSSEWPVRPDFERNAVMVRPVLRYTTLPLVTWEIRAQAVYTTHEKTIKTKYYGVIVGTLVTTGVTK